MKNALESFKSELENRRDQNDETIMALVKSGASDFVVRQYLYSIASYTFTSYQNDIAEGIMAGEIEVHSYYDALDVKRAKLTYVERLEQVEKGFETNFNFGDLFTDEQLLTLKIKVQKAAKRQFKNVAYKIASGMLTDTAKKVLNSY